MPKPFKRFIILGAMRSGSNLLEKFLNQYKGLLCHGELFHKTFIGVQGCQSFLGINIETRNKSPKRLLEAVSAANPDKITGFRFFQDHDMRVMEAALKDRSCAKIILTRDPVESFVSLQIAFETQQWLVSDETHRKKAQVRFDPEAYRIFLGYRDNYYRRIRRVLALTDQPYFEIDYTGLNKVENINRLAAFIGEHSAKSALDEPIKRQNPGMLADKILNLDEVKATKGAPDLNKRPVPVPVLEAGSDLGRLYFCPDSPLAFAPVPHVDDADARIWLLAQFQGQATDGHSAHSLAKWKRAHSSPRAFSVVQHPVSHAYRAFMLDIFATDTPEFAEIRQEIENQFGLFLPQGAVAPFSGRAELEKRGYSAEAHRICFKLFLVFVAANLADETKLRQARQWQLQSEILRRYRILLPNTIVLKQENLQLGLRYLNNLHALPMGAPRPPASHPEFIFPLREIYDPEVESLTRAAYGPDYRAFDYKNRY